jgi:predicted deacetylase
MRRYLILGIAVLSLAMVIAAYFFGVVVGADEIPFTKFNFNVSQQNENKIIVSFRNDDLSVISDAKIEEKILNIFWKYKIKQTFAFIPVRDEKENLNNDEKNKIIKLLKRWNEENKIEIALHGYDHKKNIFSLGEFKGLSYERQLDKILKGKSIVAQTINADTNIFVPPWNQADEITIRACKTAGIEIFSGYLGEKESNGVTYVNSNNVLFKPRKRYYSKKYDIPVFEDVLRQAEKGMGTVFLVAIYHSRTDFRHESDFRDW